MIDHVGLRVRDLVTATHFYDAVLGVLGHARSYADSDLIGYGSSDRSFLWPHRTRNDWSAAHIALIAPDRATVTARHAAGISSGGRDNGAPGPRTDYSPNYFAAFLLDPDGNNVEAVCAEEEAS